MRHITRALLTLALCGASVGRSVAAPENALLAEVQAEFREPQLRCEWIAKRFDRIDRTLSLYRDELANLYVSFDGARLAESATGAVQRAVFESRLLGPATVAVTVDLRRLKSPELLRPGGRLDIGFADAAGAAHPLFCGVVALVRADATLQRADVVALIPRAGTELRGSAQYRNRTEADVLKELAQSAGLGLQVVDTRRRSVQAVITRDNAALWPFLRQLAERLQLELMLQGDAQLQLAGGTFAPPPPPPPRNWNDQTWVEIAKRIARDAGRLTDAQLTGEHPRLTMRQDVADEDFLQDIAIAYRASAWWAPGRLLLREDQAWLRNAAARTALDTKMTPLQLAQLVANRNGLTIQPPSMNSAPVIVTQRDETDAELLLRVLGSNRLRLMSRDGVLYLRPSSAAGDVSDLLLRRVTITGSVGPQRAFRRSFADPRQQLLAPEQVATAEVLLDLGAAMPAVRPAPLPLADAGAVAAAFDAALGRLSAQPSLPPGRRFLQDLARVYRPTLIHLHRMRPDGVNALNAIAP